MRTRAGWLAGAVALGLALGARAADAPGGGADVHRLSEHIRILASDAFEGRGPDTPGEVKTVDYLVGQFRALGLEPGGENGGWLQAVRLNRFQSLAPTVLSVRAGGQVTPLEFGAQAVVQSRRPGVSRVDVRDAPMVFVGYGVDAPEQQWNDFKGVDLHGKIAVVLVNDPDFATPQPGRFGGVAMTYYGRWTYKFEELARQGALGVLIVHETPAAGYPWYVVRSSWTTPQFDIPRPAAERVEVEGWITRATAVDLLHRSGLDYDQLKLAAQKPDFRPVPLPGAAFSTTFAVKTESIVSHNVLARLTGATAPGETVLYGAHWDHLGIGGADLKGDTIYNGALDNASGVGGLLELAREFAAAPRTRRTVVFAAWTAEEKGLLGSEAYTRAPLYPLAKTVANINMDGLPIYGATRDVVVIGAGKGEIEDMALALAARQGRGLDPEPHPEAGGYYRSDHFSLAKVGVPALDLRAGPDLVHGGKAVGQKLADDYIAQHYHQPSDEWRADWDLSGAKQDLDLFYALGRQLADSDAWPRWKPGAEFLPARARTDAQRVAAR